MHFVHIKGRACVQDINMIWLSHTHLTLIVCVLSSYLYLSDMQAKDVLLFLFFVNMSFIHLQACKDQKATTDDEARVELIKQSTLIRKLYIQNHEMAASFFEKEQALKNEHKKLETRFRLSAGDLPSLCTKRIYYEPLRSNSFHFGSGTTSFLSDITSSLMRERQRSCNIQG